MVADVLRAVEDFEGEAIQKLARCHEARDRAECESSLGLEIVADVAELRDDLVGEETLSFEIADNVVVGRDGVLARCAPQRLVDAGPSFRLRIRVVDNRKSISVAVSQSILCDAGSPPSIFGILPARGAGSASENRSFPLLSVHRTMMSKTTWGCCTWNPG